MKVEGKFNVKLEGVDLKCVSFKKNLMKIAISHFDLLQLAPVLLIS